MQQRASLKKYASQKRLGSQGGIKINLILTQSDVVSTDLSFDRSIITKHTTDAGDNSFTKSIINKFHNVSGKVTNTPRFVALCYEVPSLFAPLQTLSVFPCTLHSLSLIHI